VGSIPHGGDELAPPIYAAADCVQCIDGLLTFVLIFAFVRYLN